MMQTIQGKRNINGINQKKGRFSSFQNLKDNKFSAYKYERNMLIGKNTYYNVTDEEDYFSQNERKQDVRNEQEIMINVKKQQQQSTSGVDNLCQLWDKLGQQEEQKNKSEIIDYNNIDNNNNKNQLTEEELLECFGEEKQQENNISNKVIVNILKGSYRINGNNQKQQTEEETDQDLMDIWGQDQHMQLATQCHNFSQQQSIQKLHQSKKQHKQQQHYDWMDQRHKGQVTNEKNTLRVNKNQLTKENNNNNDDDEQMELEDPNIILFQNKKDERQKLYSNQQDKSTYSNKPKPSTLSIINEIHLQNNTRNMIKLIPNLNYQIFDTKSFSLHPFKSNTYSYFGIQSKNFSLLQPSPILSLKNNIFYLYEFQTQQALLQMKPQTVDRGYFQFLSVKRVVSIGPNEQVVRKVVEYKTDFCYKVRVCSTKQHIATLFYKVIKNGHLYDLRLYDQYEDKHSQPIALIEVKDGYVNQCCYCDTNVFYQRSYFVNPYYAFIGQKGKSHIEKLRMILNMKNGKLTANMGIGGIESSPFNCCLENQQSLKFIYLMGLIYENDVINDDKHYKQEKLGEMSSYEQVKRRNNFIIKVGEGITPLLGLAITAGRKMYVDSFQ